MSVPVAFMLLASLLAQQSTFRSGIALVEVDVSVMRNGTPVSGLQPQNFVVTDNGVPQRVTSVTVAQLPLSVILVLDTSESVAGEELTHLIEAGQQLVRTLRAGDRAALVTFSEQVLVNVPLTPDMTQVSRALAGLRGDGATSMNDAMHVGLNLVPRDRTRPVILVFSDGRDNLSWMAPAAVADEIRHVGVVVHGIELGTEGPRGSMEGAVIREQAYLNGRPALSALTEASGGRVWSATSSSSLRTLFTQALEEMRARYLLTYTPTGVAPGGWHALKVSLKDARGDVTARPGYFVADKK